MAEDCHARTTGSDDGKPADTPGSGMQRFNDGVLASLHLDKQVLNPLHIVHVDRHTWTSPDRIVGKSW